MLIFLEAGSSYPTAMKLWGSTPAATETSRSAEDPAYDGLEITEYSLQIIYQLHGNCLISNTYILSWYFSE